MSDSDRPGPARPIKIVEKAIRSGDAASSGAGDASAAPGGLAGWIARDLHPASLMVIGVGTAAILAAGWVWSTENARVRREEQLLYAGGEIADAIASYYAAAPRHVHELPPNLRALVDDNRDGTHQRHLNAIPDDPVTGQRDWIVIRGPDGGIVGVHSASGESPSGRIRLPAEYRAFEGRASYADWVFRGALPDEAPVRAAGRDRDPAPNGVSSFTSSSGAPSPVATSPGRTVGTPTAAVAGSPRAERSRARGVRSHAGARAAKVHAQVPSFARHATMPNLPRAPWAARVDRGGLIPIDVAAEVPRAAPASARFEGEPSPMAAFAKLPTVVVPPPVSVREPDIVPAIPPSRRRAGAGTPAANPLLAVALPSDGGAPAAPRAPVVAARVLPALPPPRVGDIPPSTGADRVHSNSTAGSATACAKHAGNAGCPPAPAVAIEPAHDAAVVPSLGAVSPNPSGSSSRPGPADPTGSTPRIVVTDGPDGELILSYYGPIAGPRAEARREDGDTASDSGGSTVSGLALGGKGKRATGERGLGRDSGGGPPAAIQLASAADDTNPSDGAQTNPNPLSDLYKEPDRAKRYCMMLAITDTQACDALEARGAEQEAGQCRITAEGRQLACLRGEKIGQLSAQ